MFDLRRIVLVLVALVPLAASLANAQSKAVPTMAGILMRLNHFANDADKAALKTILDDKAATADEKTVAGALMNVQHTAAAADKAKLEAIVKDAKAAEGVKTLASVILSLNHMASDADKEKLKKLGM